MKAKSNQPDRITNAPVDRALLGDLRQLIKETRSSVAATINAVLTMLYWQIGHALRDQFSDKTFGCTQKLGSLLPVWTLP